MLTVTMSEMRCVLGFMRNRRHDLQKALKAHRPEKQMFGETVVLLRKMRVHLLLCAHCGIKEKQIPIFISPLLYQILSKKLTTRFRFQADQILILQPLLLQTITIIVCVQFLSDIVLPC
jgi:hypothetical protein